jgi:hypothetical protein
MLTLTQIGTDEFVLILSFAIVHGTHDYVVIQLERLGLKPSEIVFLFDSLHELACQTYKHAANS